MLSSHHVTDCRTSQACTRIASQKQTPGTWEAAARKPGGLVPWNPQALPRTGSFGAPGLPQGSTQRAGLASSLSRCLESPVLCRAFPLT